jgi:hypothetical protein
MILPISASQVAGITDVSLHVQSRLIFKILPFISHVLIDFKTKKKKNTVSVRKKKITITLVYKKIFKSMRKKKNILYRTEQRG